MMLQECLMLELASLLWGSLIVARGIVSRKPRPNSAHDFLRLLYCVVVLLCICVVSCPYVIYYPTVTTRYGLFVLKVPLNPKQTNKQNFARRITAYACVM